MAFPDGWSHKWPIAINADSVISSPVADWPCLITDAHIPAGAWALMQATGADLRFSADANGATELYYDDPRLDVAGESAHLYVGVPSLSASGDTTIYAWVGNAEASAPSAASKQQTYPADWAGFWPMEEGTGITVGDRTANGNDGTLIGSPAWVAVAGDFAVQCTNPDDCYINFGAMTQLLGVAEATIIVREKIDAIADFEALWSQAQSTNAGDGIAISAGLVGTLDRYYYKVSRAGSNAFGVANNMIDLGQWHTEAMVFNGAGADNASRLLAYRDGAAVSLVAFVGTIPATTSAVANDFNLNTFNGTRCPGATIGSACAITRALSAGEVTLHNLMLSDPATWATAGELVAVSTGRAYFGGRNLGKPMFRRQNL